MTLKIILFVALFGTALIGIIRLALRLHRKLKADPNWRDNLGG